MEIPENALLYDIAGENDGAKNAMDWQQDNNIVINKV
jgi:hypothetical protein